MFEFLNGIQDIWLRWIYAVATVLGFFIVSKVVVFIVEKVIIRLTSRTKTTIDDDMVHALNHPVSLLLIFIGIRLAAPLLKIMPELDANGNMDCVYQQTEAIKNIVAGWQCTAVGLVDNIALSFIILLVTIMIARISHILITNWGKKFAAKTKSHLDDQLIDLGNKFSKVIIFIFGVLYIVSLWGVEIGPFLASLGIAGIAIGFAVKDSLANVFGGISIILDNTLRVGDKIKIPSGEVGEIEEIGLRATKLRTYDNELIIIPNGIMANSKIQNYALPDPKIKVKVDFGVAYGTDTEKVKEIVMKEIESCKDFEKEPEPSVLFLEMGESALLMRGQFWIGDYTKSFSAKTELTGKIYRALNKAKIVIPYPQMDIHMFKE